MARSGAPLSLDLRKAVIGAWKTGRYSYVQLAELFGIGEASVSRLLRRYRETGGVEPRPHGGGQRPILNDLDYKRLRRLVEEHPDWTTFEFRDELSAKRLAPVSRSTIVRALARLGFTRKKSLSSPRSATRNVSSFGEPSTKRRSRRSPPTVWFIWTKPARTPR